LDTETFLDYEASKKLKCTLLLHNHTEQLVATWKDLHFLFTTICNVPHLTYGTSIITQVTEKADQSRYFHSGISKQVSIKDTVFLGALLLNAVKSVTLRTGRRKLHPNVVFAIGPSYDEDLEELNVRPMQTVK